MANIQIVKAAPYKAAFFIYGVPFLFSLHQSIEITIYQHHGPSVEFAIVKQVLPLNRPVLVWLRHHPLKKKAGVLSIAYIELVIAEVRCHYWQHALYAVGAAKLIIVNPLHLEWDRKVNHPLSDCIDLILILRVKECQRIEL